MGFSTPFDHWVAYALSGLNLLLIGAIAWMSAQLLWISLSPPQTMAEGLSRVMLANSSSNDSAPRLDQLALFGAADSAVVTAAVSVPAEVPQTRLNYQLTGIYYSIESYLSLAIIEKVSSERSAFRVGDELVKGVSVHAIAGDHVLLDRYGKIERLDMSINKSAAATSARSGSRQAASGNETAAESVFLKSYKARYINNPMALANRFRAIPVSEGGKSIGFRLKPVRGEVLMQKLGMNENDVFTAINGISLDKPFQALDALKSLRTAKNLSITFQRNGVEQVRSYSLD